MRLRAPCVDCPDKGCGPKHDTCEKYLEFKRKQKEIQDQKLKARKDGEYVYEVITKVKKEKFKRKGR